MVFINGQNNQTLNSEQREKFIDFTMMFFLLESLFWIVEMFQVGHVVYHIIGNRIKEDTFKKVKCL